MANLSELTLCEANVLHSATGDSYSCRKKKHWWQSTYEAKGTFVEQSKGKYFIKFNLSEREVCRHELPRAGKAVILRHRPNEKTKSLFIAEIKEHGIARDELLTITLSFSVSSDFVTWEEELRSKLKVYSFHIEIEENQIVQKGPATLHVTLDYIYITTNNVNGKFKALYFKNRRRSTIVCCSSRTCYSLEIHCLEGHTETIDFQSKHFELIRETLKYFENIVKRQTGITKQKESCREDIKKQFNKRSLSEELPMKDGHNEAIKLYHPPIQPSELRYSKAKVSRKAQTEGVNGEANIFSTPCIYTYDALLHRVNSLSTDNHNDIYVSSKELHTLKAIENKDFSRLHSVNRCEDQNTFSNDVFVSQTEVEIGDYLKTGLGSELRAHSPQFGSQSPSSHHHLTNTTMKSSIDTSDIISKGSIPITGKEPKELNEDQPLSEEPPSRSNTGLIPEVVVINVPPTELCTIGLAKVSRHCSQEREISKAVDISCTQESQPQSESDLDSGARPCRKISYDDPQHISTGVENDRLRKSPKGRRSVEEWIPRNLSQENLSPNYNDGAPPLFPRKSSPSLQPHLHFYENLSDMVHIDENNGASKNTIETVMYVFGNEMKHGGAWTVGVIVLQRDDNETFERLNKLENEFGRCQLTPPRPFDMTSDVKISVNECSIGFGILGKRSHIVRHGDMEQLGPSKWIVVEFHFLHNNEKFSIFKFDIGVEPIAFASKGHESHYTSQTISFVKKLARSESLPENRGMLPPPRSRLPLKTTSRREMCRDLDLPTSIGDNWKGIAAKIGLDIREIRIIEHSKYESCTEEVLQILEYRFPEKCTLEFLKEVLIDIRRPDLIEHLKPAE